jgi:Acetyltransferase (GNAT) domain
MRESSEDPALTVLLTTTIVREPEEFERLEAEWDGLLSDSAQKCFFLRWHWNWLWWQHFAPRRSDLYIVKCTDANGRLAGIAPLYRRERQIFGVPCARELAMLGTGIELKTGEYLDIFARRGHEHAVSQAVGDCLEAQRAWDRLWLHAVPAGSGIIADVLRRLRGDISSAVCDSSPFIDTSVSWDDYRHSLGRSMRRNVDYYARRLFKKYACEFRLVESVADLEPAIDDLVRLHQMRWRSVEEPGVFNSPDVELFLRRVMRRSHSEGHLRLWTLSVDGTIEAALVGFLDNGVLHYFQKGFNPDYARDDLGTAMLSLCIRASFEDQRIRSFDFMSGGADYKKLWARLQRVTVLHEVSRPNLRAHSYTAVQYIREATAATLRAVTPTRLRDVRRDWLRRRRAQRLLKLFAVACVSSTLLGEPNAELLLAFPAALL